MLLTNQNQSKNKQVSVLLTSKCKRCGRELRSKESKLRGYGLTCAIKEGIVIVKGKSKENFKDNSIDLYTII